MGHTVYSLISFFAMQSQQNTCWLCSLPTHVDTYSHPHIGSTDITLGIASERYERFLSVNKRKSRSLLVFNLRQDTKFSPGDVNIFQHISFRYENTLRKISNNASIGIWNFKMYSYTIGIMYHYLSFQGLIEVIRIILVV